MEIILAGHSLGTIFVQNEAVNHPTLFKAVMISGNSLGRSYKSTFPVPLLTLNAELDGIHRTSRVAESFYTVFSQAHHSAEKMPIILIEDVTHMDFGDGDLSNLPLQIRKTDMRPILKHEDALSRIAIYLRDWICLNHARDCDVSSARSNIVNGVEKTRVFLGPMIEAYRQEAAPHLFNACNSDMIDSHCPFCKNYCIFFK
jgi:pimeloyl-ACP methyl ester carboxylesterase